MQSIQCTFLPQKQTLFPFLKWPLGRRLDAKSMEAGLGVGRENHLPSYGSGWLAPPFASGFEPWTGYAIYQREISGKQSCKSPSCLHLAVLGSPEQFSRLLELVATRQVLPLLARKCSLTLPYCWRMRGGVVFRGVQEVQNCSPSWSLSEGEDFCVQTLYSWALGWDYPQKCVTPFWLQKGELGWAHLSLQLWNDQEEASGTTKTIFVVWWEKAWFCLVCLGVFLQDFELFITVSSGSCNISKGCPSYFVDRNMDIFGEPLVFNIISQLSNLRVETRVYCVNRCWCFYTFQHTYQPLNGWDFSPCFLF